MCGHFSLAEDILQLQQYFEFKLTEEISPRFNIAPSQQILSGISDGQKEELER